MNHEQKKSSDKSVSRKPDSYHQESLQYGNESEHSSADALNSNSIVSSIFGIEVPAKPIMMGLDSQKLSSEGK